MLRPSSTWRAVALLLLACWPGAASADWFSQAEGGFLHDSNLNNAELSQDIRSDWALAASLSLGHFRQLDSHHSLTVSADFKAETYHRFSGLNNIAAGAAISFRRKLGLGALAAWLRASVSATRLDANQDVRDGWLYRAAASAGKRLSERWELQAEYVFEKRTGDDAVAVLPTLSGDVFDLRSHAMTLDARYSATDRALIFATYTWRTGDVVSTSVPNAKIFRSSTALTRDPTFGPNARAYRLDARSHVVNVGVSQALSSRSAVNVTYQRQITHGAGNNDYDKDIVGASYTHSF